MNPQYRDLALPGNGKGGNWEGGEHTGKSERRAPLRSQDLNIQRRSTLLREGRDVHQDKTLLPILAWDPQETHGRGS
jgi:hypothetical protein